VGRGSGGGAKVRLCESSGGLTRVGGPHLSALIFNVWAKGLWFVRSSSKGEKLCDGLRRKIRQRN
jgi:hypothetical protein